MGLTKRKRAFIEIYCSRPDFNPTEAAKQAGFAYGRAKQTAYELLHRDADVMREVERRLANKYEAQIDRVEVLAKKEKLTPERVIQDIEEIEEMCKTAGPGAWQASTLVKVAELKGKYLKMWTERIEVGVDEKLIARLEAGRRNAGLKTPELPPGEIVR